MAQQDNTLGAPTEGLGQTVTFAVGSEATPQTPTAQRGQFRMNVQGGQGQLTSQARNVQEAKPNATFEVLARLAGEVLKPKIEEERQAKYFEGMQKARAGQAVTEIIDEQPAWSQFFGATPIVDGARTYTAHAKALGIAEGLEADLPNLRKLSGTEYARHVATKVAEAATGDRITDMLVGHQLTATLQAPLKNQAKANLKYQGELYDNAKTASFDAGWASLGASDRAVRTGNGDKADTLEAAIPLLSSLDAPVGEDKHRHDKLVTESAIRAIGSGNFAAYAVLRDTGKLAKLDPQDAYHVERAYHQASGTAKATMPLEFGNKIAEWKFLSTSGGSPKAIVAGAEEINATYTRHTGDPAKYLNATATASELLQLKEAEYRRLEQARKAIDSANTVEGKRQAALYSVNQDVAAMVSPDGLFMGGMKAPEIQDRFDHLRVASPENYHRVLAVQHSSGVVDKTYKQGLMGSLGQAIREGNRGMFAEAMKRYGAIVAGSGNLGRAVADDYAGDFKEQAALYWGYNGGKPMSEMDSAAAFSLVVNPPPKEATGKWAASVEKALGETTISNVFGLAFGDEYKPRDPKGLANLIAPIANQRLNPQEAVTAARRQLPNLTELAGYHWEKPTTSTNIKHWFEANKRLEGGKSGAASNNWNAAFEHTIDTVAERGGVTTITGVRQIVDTPDKVPQMFVYGTGADGNPRILHFNAEDVHRSWLDKQNLPEQRRAAATNPTVRPNAPSIYSGVLNNR